MLDIVRSHNGRGSGTGLCNCILLYREVGNLYQTYDRCAKAEIVFLLACHTAQLTDESIADEGLHLAAAMQYCGFRSVVGTMWAVADTDGQFLAENLYKQVFSSRKNWQGVPYYERTVKALRNAVRNLRRENGMTLERWVNFVHYGA